MDPLGLWVAAEVGPFAFGVDAMEESVPVWRADLPADLEAAQAKVADSERRLHLAEQALRQVDERVEAFVRVQSAAVSFDVAAEPAALPEREAARFLAGLRGEPPASPSDEVSSFGLGDTFATAREQWPQVAENLRAQLQRLIRTLTHFAWVETAQGGQTLGRTAVQFQGGFDTIWFQRVTPPQSVLHQRTLRISLLSRTTTLRLVMLVMGNAPKLAALLGSGPLGTVAALPVAWKFVNDILDEVRRLQAATTG